MGNSTSKESNIAVASSPLPMNINKSEEKKELKFTETIAIESTANKEATEDESSQQASKCPMKMDGGFLSPWMMKKYHPPVNDTENTDANTKNEENNKTTAATTDEEETTSISTSKCLIKQEKTASSGSYFGSLWGSSSKEEKVEYNVYSQPITINKSNMIPSDVNQLPSPLQKEELSTHRVKSTIPKGGISDNENGNNDNDNDAVTWTYPSPQMFYNSLARKNKLNDTAEDEIAMIVHIHNHMNEKTWKTVLQWESLNDDVTPKLLKFQGRPMDLSPKAAFKHYILGHPLPFDRHDWYVETNKELKRYVIDYYYQEESSSTNKNESDEDKNILIDVRPALDSFSSFFDRCYAMPYARHMSHTTNFDPLPLMPTKTLQNEYNDSLKVWENNVNSKLPPSTKTVNIQDDKNDNDNDNDDNVLSEEEAMNLVKSFMEAIKDCQPTSASSNNENDEKQILGTNVCMAKYICPLQHATLVKALHDNPLDVEKDEGKKMDTIIENMALCVYEKSNDVRDILNDGFDSKEEQERLFDKYGIESNVSKE